jgi:membrane-bound metal-dependent hydrolase YbcI (DUF457 family)
MMATRMPSPIGHALGGVAVAWAADLIDRRRSSPSVVAVCAGLAMLPDADLIVPGAHRLATHSVTAAALVFIVAAAVTGKVTRDAVLYGLAYASHLLLDWLAADTYPPPGIQLFWPFSHQWFISGWDIFRQTARQQFLTAPIIRQNAIAIVQEVAILGPVVAALLWLRRRQRQAQSTASAGSRS